MFVILWKSGEFEGYSDLLPSEWFEAEGEWESLSHEVQRPKRETTFTARCSLSVRGPVADLDYGGEHLERNERLFPVGAMRLIFEDASRAVVREVQWRDEGETAFEVMDVECRELILPPGPVFDPLDLRDGRKKIERIVVWRQGQQAFRKDLKSAYDSRCAITGCDIEDVLEAAHISPYLGDHTNHVTNGLLLRADIHTLFDRGLIRVDEDYRIHASDHVRRVYQLPASITLPSNPAHHPDRGAFARKWQASEA